MCTYKSLAVLLIASEIFLSEPELKIMTVADGTSSQLNIAYLNNSKL